MKFCTVRELRINASRVIRRARRERVIVTVRGRPTAVIAPLAERDFDGLQIDLYPELRDSLREAEAAIDRGEGLSFSEVKRRLRKRG